MRRPKNVQALFDWYAKNMPGYESFLEHLLVEEQAKNARAQMVLGAMLQGFEAGRQFQREHPDVESGIGYLDA